MSGQPTQDQVNAALAQLEMELSSDGVVLRSQPPELPPGDDAPPLRLGSSRVADAGTEPPVHGSTRRRSASCQPLASAPLSTLSRGGSAHSSRSLAPSEHVLSRRLAEQSQRRAEGPSSSRLPTTGTGSDGGAAATNGGCGGVGVGVGVGVSVGHHRPWPLKRSGFEGGRGGGGGGGGKVVEQPVYEAVERQQLAGRIEGQQARAEDLDETRDGDAVGLALLVKGQGQWSGLG